MAKARGLYHPEWHNNQAWIEIFVDNTLIGWETGWSLKFSFLREGKIADVFFHEIGHHIHFTTRPEYREKEDVADIWKVRLEKSYLRRRRPTLRLIFFPLRPLTRFIQNVLSKWMVKQGMMSRAEFDEEFKRK